MEIERERAREASPRVVQGLAEPLLALERYLASCGLERELLHKVKLRASQINGCAFCIDMHWKDARADGEDEQHLYMLNAWRESSLYSERERAALLWTETVTLVADGQVPDEVYDEVKRSFDDDEIVNLTAAVVAINSWNRLCIPLRAVPGQYQPARRPEHVRAAA